MNRLVRIQCRPARIIPAPYNAVYAVHHVNGEVFAAELVATFPGRDPEPALDYAENIAAAYAGRCDSLVVNNERGLEQGRFTVAEKKDRTSWLFRMLGWR